MGFCLSGMRLQLKTNFNQLSAYLLANCRDTVHFVVTVSEFDFDRGHG